MSGLVSPSGDPLKSKDKWEKPRTAWKMGVSFWLWLLGAVGVTALLLTNLKTIKDIVAPATEEPPISSVIIDPPEITTASPVTVPYRESLSVDAIAYHSDAGKLDFSIRNLTDKDVIVSRIEVQISYVPLIASTVPVTEEHDLGFTLKDWDSLNSSGRTIRRAIVGTYRVPAGDVDRHTFDCNIPDGALNKPTGPTSGRYELQVTLGYDGDQYSFHKFDLKDLMNSTVTRLDWGV